MSSQAIRDQGQGMLADVSAQVQGALQGRNLAELSKQLGISRFQLSQMQSGNIANIGVVAIEQVRRLEPSPEKSHDSYASG